MAQGSPSLGSRTEPWIENRIGERPGPAWIVRAGPRSSHQTLLRETGRGFPRSLHLAAEPSEQRGGRAHADVGAVFFVALG
jgi:hypothetical protein